MGQSVKSFKAQVKTESEGILVVLKGALDEHAELPEVAPHARKLVRIDTKGVDYVNSHGSREWIRWVYSLCPPNRLILMNCNPSLLDYGNMIQGFFPKNSVIESFNIPYFCTKCQVRELKGYRTEDIADFEKEILTEIPCAKCKGTMEIDVLVPQFFRVLKR